MCAVDLEQLASMNTRVCQAGSEEFNRKNSYSGCGRSEKGPQPFIPGGDKDCLQALGRDLLSLTDLSGRCSGRSVETRIRK